MSFVRDSVRTIVIRVILLVAGLASGIIHARWLGPEGVGILALFLLIQGFSFRFGNLGFGSGFAFFMAKKKASVQELLWLAWLIGGIMSIICYIVLFLVWKRPFSPWNDLAPSVFYWGLFTIPLLYLRNYFQRILSGQLRIKEINYSEVINTAFYIPLVICMVVIFKWGVIGAVIATVITQIMVVLYLYRCLIQPSPQSTRPTEAGVSRLVLIKELWDYGRWSYLIMFLNFYQEQFPLMFLTYFFPTNVVGIFSTGRNLMLRVQLLPQSFSEVLFPFTAASAEQDATRRTNTLCRNFIIITGVVVILLGVLAKPVIRILYGDAFLPAVQVLYVLLPAILLYPLIQFIPVHIAAFGKPQIVFFRNLFATPVCFLLCLFLVPRYGAIGAGLSISAMFLTLTWINIYIYCKTTGSKVAEVIIPTRNDWAYYIKLFKTKIMRRMTNGTTARGHKKN